MDVLEHNRRSWDAQSRRGSDWCTPVDAETIAQARAGDWNVILTPVTPAPREWFGEVAGKDVLCLASGGGQQAPTLAAAGARVTSFDLSSEQLAKDWAVAEREGLDLATVQGDMADLSLFLDGSFDLIFHPVSNVFVPDVSVVWRECYRVLRPGGSLLAGFMNPAFYLFDHADLERGGPLEVRYALPYADLRDLATERLSELRAAGTALEFSHSLDTQIGGQIAAGFAITGFYEDRWSDEATRLNPFMSTTIATRATRLPRG
jgi:SAM-dependent methyltransferase